MLKYTVTGLTTNNRNVSKKHCYVATNVPVHCMHGVENFLYLYKQLQIMLKYTVICALYLAQTTGTDVTTDIVLTSNNLAYTCII